MTFDQGHTITTLSNVTRNSLDGELLVIFSNCFVKIIGGLSLKIQYDQLKLNQVHYNYIWSKKTFWIISPKKTSIITVVLLKVHFNLTMSQPTRLRMINYLGGCYTGYLATASFSEEIFIRNNETKKNLIIYSSKLPFRNQQLYGKHQHGDDFKEQNGHTKAAKNLTSLRTISASLPIRRYSRFF